MSSEVSRFYHHLSVSETLAVPLQHAMLRYARARNDTDLLVRLVRRSDLDGAVDHALGAIPAAPVRAAWVGRAGRSAAAARAALAGEKRIGVLTALAETRALGDVAYEALAERDHPKIAAALCANPDVSAAVVERSVRALARASMRTRDASDALTQVLAAHPELAEEAARSVERSDGAEVVLRWVQRSQRGEQPVELPTETLDRIVSEVLLTELAGVPATADQWEVQRISHSLAQVGTQIATLPSLEESTLQALEELSRRIQALPQGTRWAGYRGPDTELQLALEQARTRYDAGAPDPRSCEAPVLAELVVHAVARRDSSLATQLAMNPAAGAEVLGQLRPLLGYGGGLLEILRARRGDLEATTVLLGFVGWNVEFDAAVEAAGGVEAFTAYLATQLSGPRALLPSHVWSAEVLTDEIVLDLPLAVLIAQCPAERFSRLVQQTLTFSDEESWAVIEALMEDFTGSLSELRQTVEDLAAA